MNNNYCTIYLVRHGESEANVADIRGADTPLTEKGKQQAAEFAKNFNVGHFDAIFSSPLVRAKETAEIIAAEHQLAVITKKTLRERHSGILEGKPYDQIKQIIKTYNTQRETLSFEKAKYLTPAEGFENDDQLISRYITALREIAIAYPNKTVLITSHWGAMRTLLVHLGYKTYQALVGYKFLNTAHIVLQSDGVDFFVKEVQGIEKRKDYYQ